MSQTSVLVVDDSPTMRSIVKAVLQQDPFIKVIGEAGDAYEAREKIKALNPDVLTLDIEMPKMSGLQFLHKIMTLRPMPVVMLSSLTVKGATATIDALSIGAFECVAKPTSGDFVTALRRLPDIVKAAARYKPVPKAERPMAISKPVSNYRPDSSIIAIGSSTGGVEALCQVISKFPINCPPTVITQHMPASFLKTFAARLNNASAANVSLANEGAPLTKGHVYVAPGGEHHLEVKGMLNHVCHLRKSDPVSGHRPSVDVLFTSVAASAGRRGLGVILTGMGRDGAKGLKAMRDAGARTLGQNEKTCVVYGMPKAAFALGAVQKEVAIENMAGEIMSRCQSPSKALSA